MRFAFGGIHIECSTYSRILTRMEDFTVLRGEELATSSGFSFLRECGHAFLPTLHARAVAGGPVERATYEAVKQEFLGRLEALLPLDGVYLAMHGAMFVEGMEDAEGDWIAAARAVIGGDCLVSASYDLHGNLSRRIIDCIDMMSAYRTAPHIDVEETQRRACAMLVRCAEKGLRPVVAWVPVPVLLPGERTSTEDEPAKSLYADLPRVNAKAGVLDASLLVGYVWADEPRATASVALTGTDRAVLEQEAIELGTKYWDAREDFAFGVTVGTIDEMLDRAQACGTRPVIFADSGDNPTGGGVGDRAEVLQALLDREFEGALVAGIADLPATELCYEHGAGKTIPLRIGGSLDPEGSRPVEAVAEIVFLLPTDEPRERMAVVRAKSPKGGGVTVVLTARRRPFHELHDFTSLRLDISDYKLLAVKSGYLSPELAPLANPNLMALSAGSILQDLDRLPKNRLRPPTFPFDRTFSWQPQVIFSARGGDGC